MKNLILLLIAFGGLYSYQLNAQSDLAIYWDASLSMEERQHTRELNYLDNYFRKYKNTKVLLVTFSNTIILEEKYDIQNSDWRKLRNELERTTYDGATSYTDLFKHDAKSYMVFTDGEENMDKLEPMLDKPIHIISTLPKPNAKLERIAGVSSGSYVILNANFDNLPYRRSLKTDSNKESKEGYVSGFVTDGIDLLPNVNIFNKNKNLGTTSALDGTYSIEADPADILVFTYLGKKTINIKLTQADFLNINMSNINESLEEVVVEGEVQREELVNTGNTVIDKKRIGYSVESIGEDEISALDTDLANAAQGQFTNFTLANDAYNKVDISQFLGRGRNMSLLLNQYGLVVLDGVPLAQSDSGFGGIAYSHDNIINPDMIASITYLKGLAATNKYGTIGRNGVLLITTKNALAKNANNSEQGPLGTTETYSGDAQLMDELPNTDYVQALKAAKTVDEAFEVYLNQRKKHGKQAAFFIDAYDYFQGWKNAYLSDRILSNIYEKFFDDAEILRALAYKQTESNKFEEAVFTYNQILKLKPDQAQSYSDLANAHNYAGNYQEALKIYDRIDKKRNIGKANFDGIAKTLENDFRNLINQHKNNINTAGVNPIYLKPIKHRARIIFEWNNPDIEFDLQIVNPQKRFFTWEHTRAKAVQRIAEEKQQGYGLEEFYLTSSDVGEWLFNVTYFGAGKNTKIPSFIKSTIYKNFGQPNESREVKVIRITEKNKLKTAVKLQIF